MILKSQNEQIELDIDTLGRFFCHSFCSFFVVVVGIYYCVEVNIIVASCHGECCGRPNPILPFNKTEIDVHKQRVMNELNA